jgi:hypothetical protein
MLTRRASDDWELPYYGMDGRRISSSEASALMNDPNGRRVAETTLWWGGWLSTVLLVIDHNHTRRGPPVIFETMLFADDEKLDRELFCERFSVREAALQFHIKASILLSEEGPRLLTEGTRCSPTTMPTAG